MSAPELAGAQESELTPDQDLAAYSQQQAAENQAFADHLASPQAQQERDDSATAFTGLSTSEAKGLVSETFPAVFDGIDSDPARALADSEIEHFYSDHQVQIEDPDHPSQSIVEVSDAPLRVNDGDGKHPVDLSLDPSGDTLKPENPIVEVSLPDQADSRFSVGDVQFQIAGSDPAAARTFGDTDRFYADVQPDTDFIAAPIASGLEILTQLRSPDAPQSIELPMDIPADAYLRAKDSGDINVERGGEVLATIAEPWAVDAQGRSVPVVMSIAENDRVVMAVEHQAGQYAYPILVDPEVYDNATFFGDTGSTPDPEFADWSQLTTNPGDLLTQNQCRPDLNCYGSTQGWGMYSYARPNINYAAASKAKWYYRVPTGTGTGIDDSTPVNAYISKLTLSRVRVRFRDKAPNESLNARNPLFVAAITDGNADGFYLGKQTRNSSDVNIDPGSYLNVTPCENYAGAGTCTATNSIGTSGKTANFGLQAVDPTGQLPKWRESYVGYATVYYKDDISPSWVSGSPEMARPSGSVAAPSSGGYPWADSGNYTFSATATDQLTADPKKVGLGIKTFDATFLQGGNAGAIPARTQSKGCNGEQGARCLAQDSATPGGTNFTEVPVSELPEGKVIARIQASDAAGNSTPSADLPVGIDKSAPTDPQLGGTIGDASDGSAVNRYDLSVSSTDGSRSPESERRSGVTRFEVTVDNQPPLTPTSISQDGNSVPGPMPVDCNNAAGSCALEAGYELDPSQYGRTVTIRVKAFDALGHESSVSTRSVTLRGGTQAPAEPHRLGLEKYFQYDTTPTGAGTTANVNLGSGNMVWHSEPVSNPGRGLGSVVNLTYNSGDAPLLGDLPLDSGFLGLDYDEAGTGFSISVSGLTRVNEPLGGVLIPSPKSTTPGAVTLTDADGTTHEFTPELDLPSAGCLTGVPVRYNEPAGVNLHLRRFGCLDPDVAKALSQVLPTGSLTSSNLEDLRADQLLPGSPDSIDLQSLADLGGLSPAEFIDALYLLEREDLWAITRPDGVTYYFNGFGYQTAAEDRDGNRLEYEYEKVNPLGEPCNPIDGQPVNEPQPPILPPLCEPRLERVVDASGNDQDSGGQNNDPDRDSRSVKLEYNQLSDLGLGGSVVADLTDAFSSSDPSQLPSIGALIGTAGLNGSAESSLLKLGKLKQITDHGGRKTKLSYNDQGRLEQMTQAADSGDARSFHFGYDSELNLPQISHSQLNAITDPNGKTTDITYDSSQQLLEMGRRVATVSDRNSDPQDQRTYTFVDDDNNHSAAIDLPRDSDLASDTTVTFPPHDDKASKIEDGLADSAISRSSELTWDADNNVGQLVEAAGTSDAATTQFTYDDNGALESETEAVGTDQARTTTLNYCHSAGNQRSEVISEDPGSGPEAMFVSDLLSITRPEGGTWSYELDDQARSSGQSDSSYCDAVRAGGDVVGRPTKQIDPLGKASSTEYDPATGVVTAEINENGDRTEYSDYDENGKPQVVIDPEGQDLESGESGTAADERARHRWVYRYDAVGNTTSVTDPRGSADVGSSDEPGQGHPFTTSLTYDDLYRRVAETIPKDSANGEFITRSYTYDDNDNLVQLEDGVGATTTLDYTAMDMLEAEHSPSVAVDGGSGESLTTSYQYDPEESLVEVASPRENGPESGSFITSFTVDSLGRKSAVQQLGANETLTTSYAYDRRDNLVAVVDPRRNDGHGVASAISDARAALGNSSADVRERMAYFDTNEVASQTENPAEANNAATVSFTYDQNGNKATVTGPRTDQVTEYDYSDRDNLSKVTDAYGAQTAYAYDDANQLTSITDPRGVATSSPADDYRTTFTYDHNGDLLSRSLPNVPGQYDGIEGKKVEYERDPIGDPVSITDARGNAFDNAFLDSGELKRTTRPSWWGLDWGSGQMNPDPGKHFSANGGDGASADLMVPVGGPQATEQGASGTSAEQIAAPSGPSLAGAGDYGGVSRQQMPSQMPLAGVTRLDYDNEMRMVSVKEIDDQGQDVVTQQLQYDPLGRVTKKSWPLQPSPIDHSFGYDRNGNLSRYVDGRGNATTYNYDEFDRRTSETAPGSKATPEGSIVLEATHFDYDDNGNLLHLTTARDDLSNDLTFDFSYDSFDRLKSEADPYGASWDYGYDPSSNLTSELSPGLGQSNTRSQSTMDYDLLDRIKTLKEGVGGSTSLRTTTYQYDEVGNQTKVTAPGSDSDDSGTDVEPRVIDRVFDARNLPWKVRVGDDSDAERTTITEYDANGNLRRTVNNRGIPQTNDLADAVPAVTWDGTTAQASDAAKNATVGEYDADNLLQKINMPWDSALPEGLTSSSPRSSLQQTENEKRYTRQLSYDGRGRMKSITESGTGQSPPETKYTHNNLGWITSVTDPSLQDQGESDNKSIIYSYDQQGNQTLAHTESNRGVNARTRDIIRDYWPSGLLSGRSSDASVGTAAGRASNFYYNRNRSLIRIVDQKVPDDPRIYDQQTATGTEADRKRTTFIARDDVERQTAVEERWPSSHNLPSRDTQFLYDNSGNVLSQRTEGEWNAPGVFGENPGDGAQNGTYQNGREALFDYDLLGRETKTVNCPDTSGVCGDDSADKTTTSTYYPSGDLQTLAKPNSVSEAYTFGVDGQMDHRHVTRPNSADDTDQAYSYDANGNRSTDERGTHAYNARNQLVQWDPASSGEGPITYVLDGAGSTIDRYDADYGASSQPDDANVHYTYSGERLKSVSSTLGNGASSCSTYFYDDLGSAVKVKGATAQPSQSCDSSGNQPTRAEYCDTGSWNDSQSTYYCYDDFGRQIKSRGPAQSTGEIETLFHDGLDRRDYRLIGPSDYRDFQYVGLSEQLSKEQRPNGDSATYDYDSRGNRLAQNYKEGQAPSERRAYSSDASGSVETLEDPSGAKLGTYNYDPYGELVDPTPADGQDAEASLGAEAKQNPFRMQGFYYDQKIGSYDMQARQYQPSVGRFLSQDRFEDSGADLQLQLDPLTQGRYVFAGGNPVNWIEFDGHKPIDNVYSDAQGKPTNNPNTKRDESKPGVQPSVVVCGCSTHANTQVLAGQAKGAQGAPFFPSSAPPAAEPQSGLDIALNAAGDVFEFGKGQAEGFVHQQQCSSLAGIPAPGCERPSLGDQAIDLGMTGVPEVKGGCTIFRAVCSAVAKVAVRGASKVPGVIESGFSKLRSVVGGSGGAVGGGVRKTADDLDTQALSRPDLIGRAGTGPEVRVIDGDAADAYARLAHGADDLPHPTYAGPRARLDDGTIIGLRESDKYGLTLDVNPAAGDAYRIHFGPGS